MSDRLIILSIYNRYRHSDRNNQFYLIKLQIISLPKMLLICMWKAIKPYNFFRVNLYSIFFFFCTPPLTVNSILIFFIRDHQYLQITYRKKKKKETFQECIDTRSRSTYINQYNRWLLDGMLIHWTNTWRWKMVVCLKRREEKKKWNKIKCRVLTFNPFKEKKKKKRKTNCM